MWGRKGVKDFGKVANEKFNLKELFLFYFLESLMKRVLMISSIFSIMTLIVAMNEFLHYSLLYFYSLVLFVFQPAN